MPIHTARQAAASRRIACPRARHAPRRNPRRTCSRAARRLQSREIASLTDWSVSSSCSLLGRDPLALATLLGHDRRVTRTRASAVPQPRGAPVSRPLPAALGSQNAHRDASDRVNRCEVWLRQEAARHEDVPQLVIGERRGGRASSSCSQGRDGARWRPSSRPWPSRRPYSSFDY